MAKPEQTKPFRSTNLIVDKISKAKIPAKHLSKKLATFFVSALVIIILIFYYYIRPLSSGPRIPKNNLITPKMVEKTWPSYNLPSNAASLRISPDFALYNDANSVFEGDNLIFTKQDGNNTVVIDVTHVTPSKSPSILKLKWKISYKQFLNPIQQYHYNLHSQKVKFYESKISLNGEEAKLIYIGKYLRDNSSYYTVLQSRKDGFYIISFSVSDNKNIDQYIKIFQKTLGSIQYNNK